jgi:hypothetical protein
MHQMAHPREWISTLNVSSFLHAATSILRINPATIFFDRGRPGMIRPSSMKRGSAQIVSAITAPQCAGSRCRSIPMLSASAKPLSERLSPVRVLLSTHWARGDLTQFMEPADCPPPTSTPPASGILGIQRHGDAATAKGREMVQKMRRRGDSKGADTSLRIDTMIVAGSSRAVG